MACNFIGMRRNILLIAGLQYITKNAQLLMFK